MSEGEGGATSSEWIDSENLDCRITETCQLYGIDKLECARDRAAKEDGDANSFASEDSFKAPLQDRVDSQLYIVRETPGGQPLWRCSLKENADAIAGHIHAANKLTYRLPCHSYRSMLPPLAGRPPTRSPGWLRCCMGGVLFAALQSHSEERLSSHNNHAYRLRFPEFVYCWFADSANDDADDDRWAFYYGLQLSHESDPECWLLYTLLDDTQGEDFFSFLSFAIERIRKQMGNSWEQQFDAVLSNKEATESKARLVDEIQRRGHSLDDDQTYTANDVCVPVELCKEIIYQLFYSDKIKSLEYAEELSNRVQELAVDRGSSDSSEEQVVESQDDTNAATSIDLFVFLQMVLEKYAAHKKKKVTLIRLMFDTASKGVLTDFYDAPDNSNQTYKEGLISVPQLHQILKTVWKPVTLQETTLIYREAYDALYPPSQWSSPAPDGINFESFLIAAERQSLFSRVI